jgi:uncharacterized repeat protein (TIGR01451 family)
VHGPIIEPFPPEENRMALTNRPGRSTWWLLVAAIALCPSPLRPLGATESGSGDEIVLPGHLDLASGVTSIPPPPGISGLSSKGAAPPLGGANIQVNQDLGGRAQNETTIAINRIDSDNLVGGANDYRNGDTECGVYTSSDRGDTWTDQILPRVAGFAQAGDPGVAVDANGRFYYLCMNFNRNNNDATQYVHKSLDDGQTWGPAILAAGSPMANFDDKGHIAVDNASFTPNRGNVYVSVSRLGTGKIRFNRSTDGGATFDGCPAACSDQPVNDGVDSVSGSNITVGVDGAVYVAWFNGSNTAIEVDKSTDGGGSFGADVTIRSMNAGIGGGVRPLGRVNSFPVIKAHHSNASIVYAVWAEDPPGTDDSEILFSRSLDGGANWDPPVRVNDDINPAGDFHSQFFPWMAVDPTDGEIDIVWYDDRDDPDRTDGTPLVDLYFASSTDEGLSFSINKRISTQSSDPTTNGFVPPFFGDYNGIDSLDGVAHPLWTDSSTGDQDAFTTQVGGADLTIAKSAPAAVFAGEQLFYDIVVSNAGPATAFNVVVIDTLPSEVEYVTDTDDCFEAPIGTLTCDVGNLAPGELASFTIKVAVDAGAVAAFPEGPKAISNVVVASSDQEDPDEDDNTDEASTIVEDLADLQVTKLCKPDRFLKAGEEGICSVIVDNFGPRRPCRCRPTAPSCLASDRRADS